jgi:DNA-directed RNA polymerase specialized sigma24 family protein
MSSTSHPPPTPEEELALYRRLCEGDPIAPSELCILFLEPLIAWLSERHRGHDEHLVQEAAGEALMQLIKKPRIYDSARGSLTVFLRLSAWRDLLNLLRREGRHQKHREAWSSVEDDPDGGNTTGEADDPARLAESAELRETVCAWVDTCSADWSGPEREVLRLLMAGERRLEAYAAAVGVTGRPPGEQRRSVKQVKDRVVKRLQRMGA